MPPRPSTPAIPAFRPSCTACAEETHMAGPGDTRAARRRAWPRRRSAPLPLTLQASRPPSPQRLKLLTPMPGLQGQRCSTQVGAGRSRGRAAAETRRRACLYACLWVPESV
eukprot:3165231-Prymnesium_polylepis.1